MPKNSCIMQIWAEPRRSALPICNYSQILYQFLTFTQNLKRSRLEIFERVYVNLQMILYLGPFHSHIFLKKLRRLQKPSAFVNALVPSLIYTTPSIKYHFNKLFISSFLLHSLFNCCALCLEIGGTEKEFHSLSTFGGSFFKSPTLNVL